MKIVGDALRLAFWGWRAGFWKSYRGYWMEVFVKIPSYSTYQLWARALITPLIAKRSDMKRRDKVHGPF